MLSVATAIGFASPPPPSSSSSSGANRRRCLLDAPDKSRSSKLTQKKREAAGGMCNPDITVAVRTRSGSAPERCRSRLRIEQQPTIVTVHTPKAAACPARGRIADERAEPIVPPSAAEYMTKVSQRRSPSRSPLRELVATLATENAAIPPTSSSARPQSNLHLDSTSTGDATSDEENERTIGVVLRSIGYEPHGQISSGAFSRVICVQSTGTGEWMAAKVFNPTLGARLHYRREVNLMSAIPSMSAPRSTTIRHPLMQLADSLDCARSECTACSGVILMSLALGGDAFDYVAKRGPLPDREAAELARRIFCGLDVLHVNGWVHGDVKLENVLLIVPGDVASAKLTDFGCARYVGAETRDRETTTAMTTAGSEWKPRFDGTLNYAAPELLWAEENDDDAAIFKKPNTATDAWAAGVACYIALARKLPFCVVDADGKCIDGPPDDSSTPVETLAFATKMLRNMQRDRLEDVLRDVETARPRPTSGAIALIRSVLCLAPADRSTAAECLESDWLAIEGSSDDGTLRHRAIE